jgi:hypothetical protein
VPPVRWGAFLDQQGSLVRGIGQRTSSAPIIGAGIEPARSLRARSPRPRPKLSFCWALGNASAPKIIRSTRPQSRSPKMADTVAKLFWALERATLIQDQAAKRNVDSKSCSFRLDCCCQDAPRRLLQHGVIPEIEPDKGQGISSPGTYRASLVWPCNDGERQWCTMSDWTCR